jgi:hypothetical protein
MCVQDKEILTVFCRIYDALVSFIPSELFDNLMPDNPDVCKQEVGPMHLGTASFSRTWHLCFTV